MATKRIWVAVAVACLAAVPAWAQHRERPLLQRPGGGVERPFLPREQQQESPRPDLRDQGGGRMTREERIQLRRDIGDAGRELYRREPLRRR